MNQPLEGKIRFIKREKGYGFIRAAAKRDINVITDYFFAANEIPDIFERLEIEDTVTFTPAIDHKGRRKAIELKIKGSVNE